MSAAAIPSFDQWQPSKKINTDPGKIPDFDEFAKQNPDAVIGREEKQSPAQRFFGTLASDAGQLVPNLFNVARHPLNTASNLLHMKITDLADAFAQDLDKDPGAAYAHVVELGLPSALKGAGKLMQFGAPKLAEAAMRVGKGDRIAAANPGRALIEETSAVRPASIAKDLSTKSAALGSQLEANAAGAPGPASLRPAVAPITSRINRAQGAGATSTAEQLAPMRDYFSGEAPAGFRGATTPGPAMGAPPLISPDQPPSQLLQMRREFTPNFRIRYGPAADSTIQKTGRQAYRGLTDEVKRTVPGAAEIDPRIHDMISAGDAAESTSRNAGFLQRSAGRIAAHTGALTGAVAGGHYFGLPGAVAGLLAPELLASPTAMMTSARALDWAGKGLRLMPPEAGAVSLIKRPRLPDAGQ